jgi:hypothetical protein
MCTIGAIMRLHTSIQTESGGCIAATEAGHPFRLASARSMQTKLCRRTCVPRIFHTVSVVVVAAQAQYIAKVLDQDALDRALAGGRARIDLVATATQCGRGVLILAGYPYTSPPPSLPPVEDEQEEVGDEDLATASGADRHALL